MVDKEGDDRGGGEIRVKKLSTKSLLVVGIVAICGISLWQRHQASRTGRGHKIAI